MKRSLSLLCFLILLLAAACCAAEETIPTAQELFAQNPEPDVPMNCDPRIDPLLVLVNKETPLPGDYVPELVSVDLPHKPGLAVQQLRPEAAEALKRLFQAADADGVKLGVVSGYRSYGTQKAIHARKVAQRGRSAELTSAPAGRSEHQLGLAMDVSCASINYRLNAIFSKTEEGQWVEAHCAEYGFIIRYRAEWQKITGYKVEPWHIRYVGPEHAKLVTALHVPYEIYMDYLKLCWDARSHLPAGASAGISSGDN